MDQLALSDFETQVGSVFTFHLADELEIDLELTSASRTPTGNPAPADSDRPFSLLFRGPVEHPFGQGIQALSHPKMGTMQIFLVPIQPDAEGPLYEAIFT